MEAREALEVRVQILELAKTIMGRVQADPSLFSARLHVHPEDCLRFAKAATGTWADGMPRPVAIAAGLGSVIYTIGPDGQHLFMGYPVVQDPAVEPGEPILVPGPRQAVKS